MNLMLAALVLIVLLVAALEWGRFHPIPERALPPEPQIVGQPPPEWLAVLSTGELAEHCLRLLSRMGYTMLAQIVEGGRAEITATDALHHAHRVLIEAYPLAAGPITHARLRQALEHAQLEGAQRALLVGVAGFTREAQRAAERLPVELVDSAGLEALLREHLPELAQEHPAPMRPLPGTAAMEPAHPHV